MQFSKLQRNSRRLGLQKKVLVTSSLLKKDRMVTNLYCSNPGRPSCPIWSQFGNASRWGLRDFSRHSCTTAVSPRPLLVLWNVRLAAVLPRWMRCSRSLNQSLKFRMILKLLRWGQCMLFCSLFITWFRDQGVNFFARYTS